MERAGNHLKRKNVWQVRTCPQRDLIASPASKIGSGKRRLSLRSENVGIRPSGGATTTQSPSFPTEQQPGKENKLPFELRSSKTIVRSKIRRKESRNPAAITDSAKKVINRRLSDDYEDRLPVKGSRRGSLDEPIIFPPRIGEPESEANADHRANIKPRIIVYDDQNDPETDPRVLEIIAGGNDDTSATFGTESGTKAGYPDIRGNLPILRDLPYYVWKSYEMYYAKSESTEKSGANGPADVPDSRSTESQEITDSKFRIERVDASSYKSPAKILRRDVKSGAAFRRPKVPPKGGEIPLFTKQMDRLSRRFQRSAGDNNVATAAVTGARYNVFNSNMRFKPMNEVKNPSPDTVDPSAGAIKKTSRFHGKFCGPFHETNFTVESIDVELARRESCHKVSKSFLKGRNVTPEQRKIVVNFLISVHAYLFTSSSTLYQAIKMFDAILDVKDVAVEELQLVALGTTWIAIKNMETKVPTASEMISFAKDMYHAEGPRLLCKCERKILETLDFNIRFPDPSDITAYRLQQLWSSLGSVAKEPSIREIVTRCSGYLMDVALLEENYSNTPSELLAAAVTQTAARLVLQDSSSEYTVDQSPWNNEETNRQSYTQEEIGRIAGRLIQGVLDSAKENSPTSAVYKKYKNVRYDNTSDYLVAMMKKLLDPTPEKRNL